MEGPCLPCANRSIQTGQPDGQRVSVVMGMIASVVGMTARVCRTLVFVTVTMNVIPVQGVTVVKRGYSG